MLNTEIDMFQPNKKKHRSVIGVFFGLFSSVCISDDAVLSAFTAFGENKESILASQQALSVDGFQMFPLAVDIDASATRDEADLHIAITSASLFTQQLQGLTHEICIARNADVDPAQSIKVTGLPMQMVYSDRSRSHFIKVLSTPVQELKMVLGRYCQAN